MNEPNAAVLVFPVILALFGWAALRFGVDTRDSRPGRQLP